LQLRTSAEPAAIELRITVIAVYVFIAQLAIVVSMVALTFLHSYKYSAPALSQPLVTSAKKSGSLGSLGSRRLTHACTDISRLTMLMSV